ncbi:MAG: DUF4238 domain-containing protein [Gammaproteobacteria bacterium]|nr:DUF4238 domain-containing protein [Gammaproteobacteria bacterium]
MNTPTRHHYIPIMLLKRFVDDAGKLHAVGKQPPRRVFSTSPENLFVESNLYTQIDDDGNRDISAEKNFAELERNADLVVEKVVHAARAGREPRLTPEEKKTWDEFLYRQWIRVPQVRDNLEMEDIYQSALREAEEIFGPLTEKARNSLDQRKEEAKKGAWVKMVGLLNAGDSEVMETLAMKGLAIAVIRNPRKSFVIGSLPIIKITPSGHTHLADPRVEALLPVAHDIIITPGHPSGTEEIIDMTDTQHIRSINRCMFEQSDWTVGRSRNLIESLAHPR